MLLTGKAKRRVTLLFSAAFAVFAADAAIALDAREAEAVVTVLEKLSAETGGSVYYDEDAAQEWFEIDEQSMQAIPAAGFSRDSWKIAFDQTVTGFIASIPQAELDRMMESFVDGIGELGKMTPEQKQEAAEALRGEMGRFDAIRRQGAQYRAIVGPYAQRLRAISLKQ